MLTIDKLFQEYQTTKRAQKDRRLEFQGRDIDFYGSDDERTVTDRLNDLRLLIQEANSKF